MTKLRALTVALFIVFAVGCGEDPIAPEQAKPFVQSMIQLEKEYKDSGLTLENMGQTLKSIRVGQGVQALQALHALRERHLRQHPITFKRLNGARIALSNPLIPSQWMKKMRHLLQ